MTVDLNAQASDIDGEVFQESFDRGGILLNIANS